MNTNSRSRSAAFLSGPLLRLWLLVFATAQTAHAEVVGTVLQRFVGFVTGPWGIAAVVLGTFYFGIKAWQSDRGSHDWLGKYALGCILIIGCQIFANQYFAS